MILPENGSVVIIDDQSEEALPIIEALSRNGISSTYYKGNNPELLPKQPIQIVRIVFLDLQLIETSDEHQIAKNIINVLEQIISPENGPYILIIWSKNRAKYEGFVEAELKKHPFLNPLCVIGFNKRECIESKVITSVDTESIIERILSKLEGRIDEGDEEIIRKSIQESLSDEYRTEFTVKHDAIEIIEKNIKEALEKAGVFHLFVIWENLIKNAASKIVKEVTDTCANDNNWEMNMRNTFRRMGIARIGKNDVAPELLIRESLNTFNSSFVDSLEVEIKKINFPSNISLDAEFIIGASISDHEFKLIQESDGEAFVKDERILIKANNRDGLLKSLQKAKNIDDEDKDRCLALIQSYDNIPPSLNTKLHIEESPSQDLIPGNLYFNEEIPKEKKEKYLSTFFKSIDGKLDEYYLIDLEVSPICDYAQDKWKRSRALPGVLYPSEYERNLKSKTNFFYDVEPDFNLIGRRYRIRFDFHLFNALDKQIAKDKEVKFRLKRELLLDIVAQLSAHVNRPGISFIS